MTIPVIKLKKDEDRRLRAGHLWIFSNEIDVASTPIKLLPAGTLVAIKTSGGVPVGHGLLNPGSLIAVRLIDRLRSWTSMESVIRKRLEAALAVREECYTAPFYRWVFGESDGLPGLVIDRYGDHIVIQITTAGMEAQRQLITETVQSLLQPKGILLRNDSPARELEGLSAYIEEVGDVPEEVEMIEHGVRFKAPLKSGQKTGWFYDQCENRGLLQRYVQGKRVLDVCSYIGAWGVQAAACGAAEVTCLDASASALEFAEQNAARNDVTIKTVKKDMFDGLKALKNKKATFDVIILDPPALIKRKKDKKSGKQAYQQLNQLAISLLSESGVLISGSCSYHLAESELLRVVQSAAVKNNRFARLLYRGQQGLDHPVHPAIVETQYLKMMFFHISPNV